jgi:hypothetical protein
VLLSRIDSEPDPEILQQLLLWFRYRHKDDRAVPSICRLGSHSDYMVRTCVADVLGAYRNDDRARSVLFSLRSDSHPNVRAAADEE